MRLSDFGLNAIERHLISKRMIEAKCPTFLGSVRVFFNTFEVTVEVTHCAPDLIKAHLESGIGEAPLPDSVKGDVYALGCIVYQIVHRLPLVETPDEAGK